MPLDIVMVSWFQQPIAATFALSLFAIDWSCQVGTLWYLRCILGVYLSLCLGVIGLAAGVEIRKNLVIIIVN